MMLGTEHPDPPIVIQVEDVSKRFVIRKDRSIKERLLNAGRGQRHRSEFWALRDVSVSIVAGTTVGLVGANGSGKSTLLKTIGGVIQPTTGVVRRRGRLAALLELGAGFHPDLTGRENVYLNASILGLSRAETDAHFDSIVDFAEVHEFIDTQVKFYSSGMYVRLAFAIAIHVDPDVLLIDEVLAVGDEAFQRKCLAKIRDFQNQGKTIVLVTHSLAQVGELCDRVIVLNEGRVQFDGQPADGIRILRDGFAERLHGEEVSSSAPSGIALSSITVENTEVHDDDELVVVVGITSATPQSEWRVVVEIETSLGQIIWATDTQRLGLVHSGTGEFTLRLALRNLGLAAGSFSVSAAVATAEHGEVDRINQGARFTMLDDSKHLGLIKIDTTAAFLD